MFPFHILFRCSQPHSGGNCDAEEEEGAVQTLGQEELCAQGVHPAGVHLLLALVMRAVFSKESQRMSIVLFLRKKRYLLTELCPMRSWVVFGIILVHFVSSFDVSPSLFLQVNLSKISSFTVRCNYSRPTKLESWAFLTCWICSQDCLLNTGFGRPRCMSCFCAFKLTSNETCVIVIFVLLLKLLQEEVLGLPCSSFKWRRIDGCSTEGNALPHWPARTGSFWRGVFFAALLLNKVECWHT